MARIITYYLGMLGTELLSHAHRERFQAARHKVVIVPPCLRAQPEGGCQAVATLLGAQCQACTPTCRVYQLTCLGQKRGFEVVILPDELRALGQGRAQGDLGIVGISCALTNWSGGWETDALGLPAQGVLLDYVGCQFHWDRQGFTTDVNVRTVSDVVMGQPGARRK